MRERSCSVEALEERLQLSSTSFVDGRLSIDVTGSDRVHVSAAHGEAIVKLNGHTADIGSVAAKDVTEIVVDADVENSGNNRIDLSRVTRSRFAHLTGTTVFGGSGNDTLLGSSLSDELDGGDGNDRLEGRSGADRAKCVVRPADRSDRNSSFRNLYWFGIVAQPLRPTNN